MLEKIVNCGAYVALGGAILAGVIKGNADVIEGSTEDIKNFLIYTPASIGAVFGALEMRTLASRMGLNRKWMVSSTFMGTMAGFAFTVSTYMLSHSITQGIANYYYK